MAFGKDDKQLQVVGTYRQQATSYSAQRSSGGRGGGGSIPNFIDRYKPSLHELDSVRIVPGSYMVPMAVSKEQLVTQNLPFFPFHEHFDGSTKQSITCSAGPFAAFKDKRDPCRGCDIFWETMTTDGNGRMKRGNRMSYREMFAFTVIHFAPYAHIPQVDRTTGQPRTNEAGKPYMEWVRVLSHEKTKYVGCETKLAHRLHWPMGSQHYNTLWSYDKNIGDCCSICGDRDCIRGLAWCCAGCGEALIELDSTTLPPDEVDKMTLNRNKCPRCATEAFLMEIFECTNCTPAGRDPKRATIFDVDLSLQRVQTNDGTDATVLKVAKWSNPRPVDPQFQELNKPMALEKIYAPTPMEAQVRKYGVAGAPARTPVTGSTPYGR